MPIITISRQYGSGGSLLAAGVAQELGWPLLDNAFVETVASLAGVTPEEVSEREERVPSLVDRLLRAFTLGSPETMPTLLEAPPGLSEERLLALTHDVIVQAAQHGPAVFVGRGAQCILAQRHDALHVFCHAPHPALVARTRERLSLSQEEATRLVDDRNAQREQYVHAHFDREWRAVDNYHLTVDTAMLGLPLAVRLVVEAQRGG